MSETTGIYEQRRGKLEALSQLGVNPYPSRYDPSHSITEAVAEFGTTSAEDLEASVPRIRVAGRLVALRGHGKTAFGHLSDGATRLQIYLRKDTLEPPGFQIFKLLDVGDYIGVAGKVFRTRTGELSVMANELTFLAIDTRTPYTTDFIGADGGKTAHYMLRWVNTKGEQGPWSETASATIGA